MKKYILLIIIVWYTTAISIVQAQISINGVDSTSAKTKSLHRSSSSKPFYLGVRLGLNYANLNFNRGYPRPAVPIETQWKTGLVAGITIQIPVTKRLALQQEYLFAQLRSEVTGSGPLYTLKYLSLPVMAKYTIFPKVAVVVGIQFDLLLSAKEFALGQTNTITHDTEERGFNALVGLEAQLSKHVRSSARFLRGLNHITLNKNSVGEQELKTELVQLTLDVTL